MESKQYRIGNWVYPNDENHTPWQISELGEHEANFINEKGVSRDTLVSYSELQPIPLSPELLIKIGFELTDDGISPFWRLVIGQTEVISIEDDWSFGLNAEDETSKQGYAAKPDLCKYLHQLQNLYFSLTGTELNIQL